MENKYFTPAIEDIHIGYECEIKDTDSWDITVLSDDDVKGIIYMHQRHSYNVRVPYLTKEQIEAEGWIYYSNNNFEINPRWFCSWHPDQDRMEIYDNENENNFAGECKDINTFRKIVKLLNIK